MTQAERDKLQAELSAFLDGETDAEDTRRLEALLRDSAEVRELLEELRSVASELAALPRAAAPRELTARIAAAVLESQRPHARTAGAPRRLRWVAPLVGIAAGVLLWFSARSLFPPLPSAAPRSLESASAERSAGAPLALREAPIEAGLQDKLRGLGDSSPPAETHDAYDAQRALAAQQQEQLLAMLRGPVRRSLSEIQSVSKQVLDAWKFTPSPLGEAAEFAAAQTPQIEFRIAPKTAEEYNNLVQQLDRLQVAFVATPTTGIPPENLALSQPVFGGEFVGGQADATYGLPGAPRPQVFVTRAYDLPAATLEGRDLLHWIGEQASADVSVTMHYRAEGLAAVEHSLAKPADAGVPAAVARDASAGGALRDAAAKEVPQRRQERGDDDRQLARAAGVPGGRGGQAVPGAAEKDQPTSAAARDPRPQPAAARTATDSRRERVGNDESGQLAREKSEGAKHESQDEVRRSARGGGDAGGGRGTRGRAAESAEAPAASRPVGGAVPSGEARRDESGEAATASLDRRDELEEMDRKQPESGDYRVGLKQTLEPGTEDDVNLGVSAPAPSAPESRPADDAFLVAEARSVLAAFRLTFNQLLGRPFAEPMDGRPPASQPIQLRVIVLPPTEQAAPTSAPH